MIANHFTTFAGALAVLSLHLFAAGGPSFSGVDAMAQSFVDKVDCLKNDWMEEKVCVGSRYLEIPSPTIDCDGAETEEDFIDVGMKGQFVWYWKRGNTTIGKCF